ncbi:MAG: response regulator [Candidatus Hydrogenedentota bacterium]
MKKNILVIEDEHNLRNLYIEELCEDGYRCYGACNGQEALGLIAQHNFDLIMVDIKLPDISGIELLQRLKSFRGKIPIFIVTAFGQLKNHFAFTDADEFITKSSDLAELKAKISKYLKKETPTV